LQKKKQASRIPDDSIPISPHARQASLTRIAKAENLALKPIRFAPGWVKLALRALAIFNLPDVNINLLHFIRQTATVFLDDGSSGVRKQAAVTCSKLLVRVIEQMETEKRYLHAHIKELVSKTFSSEEYIQSKMNIAENIYIQPIRAN